MKETDAVIQWLLEGDPSIRWQVHRDLLGSPKATVDQHQAEVSTAGWGVRLLERQSANGRWAADRGPQAYRGLYIPKWTSTTYTLLMLTRLGLDRTDQQAMAGCEALVNGARWLPSGGVALWLVPHEDICVDAMVLSILEYFDFPSQQHRDGLLERLLSMGLPDGGWNCRGGSIHSSFNTTISALEALQWRVSDPTIAQALTDGREFLLVHRLFRSHRTGNVVSSAFTRLRNPVGWQYDVLRAIDHFVAAGARYDSRLDDALELIVRRRHNDGRWAGARHQPGALHFELEPAGEPSRWVTMRCLHALRTFGAKSGIGSDFIS